MERNSNELTKIHDSSITKILKRIASFFYRNDKKEEIKKEFAADNSNKVTNKNSDFKLKLSGEYNEIKRLTRLKELYEKDETYIKNISTEDLIKLTEMNNRNVYDMENEIKRVKASILTNS